MKALILLIVFIVAFVPMYVVAIPVLGMPLVHDIPMLTALIWLVVVSVPAVATATVAGEMLSTRGRRRRR